MSLVSKFQRSQWHKFLCQYFIILFQLWLLKSQTLFGRLLKYIVLFWFQQVDTLVFIGYSSNKREDTCHFILRFLFHFCFFNNSHFIIKLNWSIYLGYNQDSIEKNSTGVWENFKQCNSACDLLGISIFKWSKLLPFLLIYVSTCTGPLILKRIWLLWLILKNFFNLPLELY